MRRAEDEGNAKTVKLQSYDASVTMKEAANRVMPGEFTTANSDKIRYNLIYDINEIIPCLMYNIMISFISRHIVYELLMYIPFIYLSTHESISAFMMYPSIHLFMHNESMHPSIFLCICLLIYLVFVNFIYVDLQQSLTCSSNLGEILVHRWSRGAMGAKLPAWMMSSLDATNYKVL